MDVAGRDQPQIKAAGKAGQPAVAGMVVTPVGPLDLDSQVFRAEPATQLAGHGFAAGEVAIVPGRRDQALPGAAGQADQPLGPIGQ